MTGHLEAHWPRPERKALCLDPQRPDLRWQPVIRIEQHVKRGLEALRFFPAAVASDAIRIAADGHQRKKGTKRLHPDARPVDAMPGNETGRPLSIVPRCGSDVLRRHTALRLGPRRREFAHMSGEAFEAVAPSFDE